MKNTSKKIALLVFIGFVSIGSIYSQSKTVNFYNWSDYISEDTLPNFTKKTGIKVNYDTYDSNDVLFSKLLAGKTGYDIVVPSASYLAKQVRSGIYQKLDKSKLKNYKYLDKDFMKILESYDPKNQHAIPYLWGTTGIGYNVKKIREILGDDAPIGSLELLFNPKYASKLASCGITLLDAADEVLPIALLYLKDDPKTMDSKKLSVKSLPPLQKIRPYIKYFHSSKYIQDLANGEVCISLGWSGDILQAKDRAEEAENGVEIEYYVPKEGAVIWFDLMAIPKDAKNVENAYKLIDYLIDPKIMADITNYVAYPNAISESLKYIDDEIKNDTIIYPPQAVRDNLFALPTYPTRTVKLMTRAWTKLKTSK